MNLIFFNKDGTLSDTWNDCPYNPNNVYILFNSGELKRPNGLIHEEGYVLVTLTNYPHCEDRPFYAFLHIPNKYKYAMEAGEMLM